jgi:hypothetical protein
MKMEEHAMTAGLLTETNLTEAERDAYRVAGCAVVASALQYTLAAVSLSEGVQVTDVPAVKVRVYRNQRVRELLDPSYREATEEERHAEAQRQRDKMWAAILAAGNIAVDMRLGEPFTAYQLVGGVECSVATSEGDWMDSTAIALINLSYADGRLARPSRVVAFIEQARTQAHRHLKRRWPAVEALATALMEQRSLNWLQTTAIIVRALKGNG